MELIYGDYPCGAGKTRAMSKKALQLARAGRKVNLISPTTYLLQQTQKEINSLQTERRVRVTAIHGENGTSVVERIVEHFKTTPAGGEILLTTHSAHERLPVVHGKMLWDLIVDEMVSCIWSATHNLTHTHPLLTDCLTAAPTGLPEYYRVELKSGGCARKMLREAKNDDVYRMFETTLAKIESDHWQVYVDAEQYDNLMSGRSTDRRQLIFHGVLQPSIFKGFRSVLLVAADAGESALFHLWPPHEVSFIRDESMARDLRYCEHPNGYLLTIRYLQKEPWSKVMRDKVVEGQKVFDAAISAVKTLFEKQKFVWLGNTDISDSMFKDAEAVRLPNTPHGVNHFQHYHNAALLSALNPPPSMYRFLDAHGLSGEDVRIAIMRAQLYQAACRISLRNPDNHDRKTVVVPDRDTALWMQTKFPGSQVAEMLGIPQVSRGKPGRPRKYADDAARKRVEREAKRQEMIETVHLLQDVEAQVQGPKSYGTVYESLYSTRPLEHINMDAWPSFVSFLHDAHRMEFDEKLHQIPWVPGEMDFEGRKKENVLTCRVLALDNDGADLDVETFVDLFPHLRMVIANSFSSTWEAPRWRVFVELSHAVNTEVYTMLYARMMKRLNQAGYWSSAQLDKMDAAALKAKKPHVERKCHGFDSRPTPNYFFFLPSQAKMRDESFFIDCRKDRGPLQVLEWIEAMQPKVKLKRDTSDGVEASAFHQSCSRHFGSLSA